jgi:hypothetical protein
VEGISDLTIGAVATLAVIEVKFIFHCEISILNIPSAARKEKHDGSKNAH